MFKREAKLMIVILMSPIILGLLAGVVAPKFMGPSGEDLVAGQAFKGDLYKWSVNEKNVCGKPLIMAFEELERAENYSVCKIKYEKGAVFASVAFEVRCYCEIAKSRNAKFFAKGLRKNKSFNFLV